MRFLSRRLVMPNDLNFAGSLFGGRILEWIDEEAYIFAACQLDSKSLVTKHIGAISFETSAFQGDVVEFGLGVKKVGRTSLTVTCVVRNKHTKQNICVADDIVFVHIEPDSRQPRPHNKTREQLDSLKLEAPE
ncbi:Acyl-CoA hydrolase [Pseudidiomarina planktonica]|uniref:Acyl-CoA hydrolase n=1 Tax=Pseudidiomarina planktonica TaxID=1323738 RepID=A0A1Y6ESH0_9GAMM|nr:hotdog domain-containing protein [Pseudidiomarina planktonica]RUO65741.1 acyl-CoA thioesterase [Pseudidiomarina planktonica]SMQ63133.1 Acyl-CoA hydrolase [Pseudidiomarina planktonica]